MAEEVQATRTGSSRGRCFGGLAITGVIYVLVALTSLAAGRRRSTLEESSGPLLEVVKVGGVDVPAEGVRADRAVRRDATPR